MKKIYILIPIYNDWESVSKLINEINFCIKDLDSEFSLIIVNDASNNYQKLNLENIESFKNIKIVNMKKNKGHARSIATGLKYIHEKKDYDYIIPMDGDGEDRPEEIIDFIYQTKKFTNKSLVGKRVKRSEDLIFKICYELHKLITLTFAGKSIKFGNYTCLPKSTVEKMINEKATWNSFSGSLVKVEKDLIEIPSIRGERYFGPSKMSFFKLVKHSLSIISVFRRAVLVRSALFIVVYILLIKSNASILTSIPLLLLLIMIYSVSSLALRENMDEFDQALSNIDNIDTVK
ncbi:glycosyltransferase [Candidatus Pelagibacter sp.]|nr:glycosyltransferase [Candidatus Pelagibacter sp.]